MGEVGCGLTHFHLGVRIKINKTSPQGMGKCLIRLPEKGKIANSILA
jgi:hypothetical protein